MRHTVFVTRLTDCIYKRPDFLVITQSQLNVVDIITDPLGTILQDSRSCIVLPQSDIPLILNADTSLLSTNAPSSHQFTFYNTHIHPFGTANHPGIVVMRLHFWNLFVLATGVLASDPPGYQPNANPCDAILSIDDDVLHGTCQTFSVCEQYISLKPYVSKPRYPGCGKLLSLTIQSARLKENNSAGRDMLHQASMRYFGLVSKETRPQRPI